MRRIYKCKGLDPILKRKLENEGYEFIWGRHLGAKENIISSSHIFTFYDALNDDLCDAQYALFLLYDAEA